MRRVGARAALVVGLLLTPALAFSSGSVPRDQAAAVVADGSSYVGLTVNSPLLRAGNSYQSVAFSVAHKHVSSADLALTYTKTSGDARFVLMSTSGTLTAGTSQSVSVRDASLGIPAGTYVITVQVDASVRDTATGKPIGAFTATRSVTVTTGL